MRTLCCRFPSSRSIEPMFIPLHLLLWELQQLDTWPRLVIFIWVLLVSMSTRISARTYVAPFNRSNVNDEPCLPDKKSWTTTDCYMCTTSFLSVAMCERVEQNSIYQLYGTQATTDRPTERHRLSLFPIKHQVPSSDTFSLPCWKPQKHTVREFSCSYFGRVQFSNPPVPVAGVFPRFNVVGGT